MEELLRRFAREALEVIEGDGKEARPNWLLRGCGLCVTFDLFLIVGHVQSEARIEAAKMLREEFARRGLNVTFPFNASSEEFKDECANGSTYSNPARLDFLRELAL